MAPLFFLTIFLLSFLQLTYAQGRSPHGLAYQNPTPLSPSALEFFHPKSYDASPSPMPTMSRPYSTGSSAVAQSTLAHESSKISTSNTSGSSVGLGGVVGIVFGFVLAVFAAMGVYYVVVTRRTNATKANHNAVHTHV